MKRFYIFRQRGMTDGYFCGNIHEALPSDLITVNGDEMSFEIAEGIGACLSFGTHEEVSQCEYMEMERMADDDEYASQAMCMEEYYGTEGVDDCRQG